MPAFYMLNNEPDVRSFSTGQVIFNEGQPSDGMMFAVLEGEVELVKDGRVLATNPAGGVFGEMGLSTLRRAAQLPPPKRIAAWRQSPSKVSSNWSRKIPFLHWI